MRRFVHLLLVLKDDLYTKRAVFILITLTLRGDSIPPFRALPSVLLRPSPPVRPSHLSLSLELGHHCA